MAKRRRSTTKADLVEMVYKSHGGLTKHEAADVVDTILKTMKTNLLEGKAVKIHNFGVLEVVQRKGRRGVDPSSGDRIYIPPKKGLSFRASDRLKRVLAPEDEG